MLTGTTKSGFKYEINESIWQDMLYMEAMDESNTNGFAFVKAAKRFFGDDYDRACEHVKREDGLILAEDLGKIMNEIAEASEEGKKLSI